MPPGSVKCCRSPEHDEVHHNACKKHAEQNIPEAGPERGMGRLSPLSESFPSRFHLLLNLLVRLPGLDVRR